MSCERCGDWHSGDCASGAVERLGNAYRKLYMAMSDFRDACKKMLEVTGGSEHWNGGTQEALKMMEVALAKYERQ